MDLMNIEYRAKPKKSKHAGKDGYVYGFLCKNASGEYCIQANSGEYKSFSIVVYESTISQFVCEDKNGNKVYSDDRVRYKSENYEFENAEIKRIRNGWRISEEWLGLSFEYDQIELIKQ